MSPRGDPCAREGGAVRRPANTRGPIRIRQRCPCAHDTLFWLKIRGRAQNRVERDRFANRAPEIPCSDHCQRGGQRNMRECVCPTSKFLPKPGTCEPERRLRQGRCREPRRHISHRRHRTPRPAAAECTESHDPLQQPGLHEPRIISDGPHESPKASGRSPRRKPASRNGKRASRIPGMPS